MGYLPRFLFQFYLSSIKRLMKPKNSRMNAIRFNSTLVQLKD